VVALAAAAYMIFRHRLVGQGANADGPEDAALGMHSWGWWASAPSRRAYRSLVRWAHWLGLSPGPAATPAEQAQAFASGLPAVGPAAMAVAEAYSLERYGLRPVDGKVEEEEWNRARPSLVRAWLVRRGIPFLSGLVRRRPYPKRRKTRPVR
jgi:Domain of unknown function (DUF4129)